MTKGELIEELKELGKTEELFLMQKGFKPDYLHRYGGMTLSTKACPIHLMIVQWVKESVEKMANIKSVDVEVVWEPALNITMADDNVKKALGA